MAEGGGRAAEAQRAGARAVLGAGASRSRGPPGGRAALAECPGALAGWPGRCLPRRLPDDGQAPVTAEDASWSCRGWPACFRPEQEAAPAGAWIRAGRRERSSAAQFSVRGVVRLENARRDSTALRNLVPVLACPFPNGLGLFAVDSGTAAGRPARRHGSRRGGPRGAAGVTNKWRQNFAQFISVLGGEVDLVPRTVETESDRLGGGSTI